MLIGYGKIGRSPQLNPKNIGVVGGDIDTIYMLKRLAEDYPQHTFMLLSRFSRETPEELAALGYPPNVINPWPEWHGKFDVPTVDEFMADRQHINRIIPSFRELTGDLHERMDHIVLWAGQHGSVNSFLPQVGTDWHEKIFATPHYNYCNYAGWVLDFVSRWRDVDPLNREETWLCPDPRNPLKGRELKWPMRQPVVSQHNFLQQQKFERHQDFGPLLTENFKGERQQSVWVTKTEYAYYGLELSTVKPPREVPLADVPGEHEFGIILNENRKSVKENRLKVLQEYVLNMWPNAPVYGKWTKASLAEMRPAREKIETIPPTDIYDTLRTFRTTLTTPASGSGWATSKPWECFAAGTVCFFHPLYDTQGHILPLHVDPHRHPDYLNHLVKYLRVRGPEDFWRAVQQFKGDDALWKDTVLAQRYHFEKAWRRYDGGLIEIKRRIDEIEDGSVSQAARETDVPA